ncbi:unnamed protein product, partial [Amoebophrya sp. A25]
KQSEEKSRRITTPFQNPQNVTTTSSASSVANPSSTTLTASSFSSTAAPAFFASTQSAVYPGPAKSPHSASAKSPKFQHDKRRTSDDVLLRDNVASTGGHISGAPGTPTTSH